MNLDIKIEIAEATKHATATASPYPVIIIDDPKSDAHHMSDALHYFMSNFVLPEITLKKGQATKSTSPTDPVYKARHSFKYFIEEFGLPELKAVAAF